MTDERDRLLPDWSVQYYVAGRMAARGGLVPIYGNLLHHAVEMFLKTALLGVVNRQEMKNKYSHDLVKLWERFKAKEGDSGLIKFDATIRTLHEFEDLRYPDAIPHAGLSLSTTWHSSDAGKIEVPPGVQKYEVVISDVDRLVIEIMKRIPLNPKYFMHKVGSGGHEALRHENPHASDWLD